MVLVPDIVSAHEKAVDLVVFSLSVYLTVSGVEGNEHVEFFFVRIFLLCFWFYIQ